ncbi:MAG: ribbon-helix-helix protein, CopG family [Thaumarchaeota archaeon]|nr:ribbon-helix-helix protein, CopG family [Nitrososphaerota archaeon]
MGYSAGYTSIKVPKVLAEKIQVVAQEEGYRSVSEFMLDAGRRRLEYFQKRD